MTLNKQTQKTHFCRIFSKIKSFKLELNLNALFKAIDAKILEEGPKDKGVKFLKLPFVQRIYASNQAMFFPLEFQTLDNT